MCTTVEFLLITTISIIITDVALCQEEWKRQSDDSNTTAASDATNNGVALYTGIAFGVIGSLGVVVGVFIYGTIGTVLAICTYLERRKKENSQNESSPPVNTPDSEGIQQICVQSEAVPPAELAKGDVGGIQQPSDRTTYQSYCRNIRAVYQRTPIVKPGVFPPTMGRVQYINLAILKSEKLMVNDDCTIMTIQRSADDILCKKETIGYMELFHGLERGSKILVEGRPGCGKTTLLDRISHDWATGKILTSIGLLLLVPLRRFHGKTTEVGLNNMLQLYDTGDLCRSVGTQISLSGGEGVCIVLDGLDEYPQCSEPGNFVLELLKGNKLPNAVIVSSSRPAAAHHLRQYASKRVEVLGFLVPQIQQYVEEHYKQDDEKLKSLNTYLECHPNIRHMCYLPLHLAMVVYLNDILKGKPLPHTETGVYDKFAKYTLFRDERRDPRSNLEQLSDLKQLHPETLEVFRNICSLAFSAAVHSQQIFSRKEVQEVFGSSKVRLESLGLLTEDKLLGEDGLEKTYSFSHLTFQEFLAAHHLTELPAVEQIKAAKEHAGDKHMGVIWKFYCGLTKLAGGVAMDVFRVLLQQGRFSPLLLILSVHESQNQDACCELLSSKNGVLDFSDEVLTPADMLAVAYCLLNASTSLTELCIDNCHLGSEELRIVTSECSFPFTNLKCLSFQRTEKVVSSVVTFLGKAPNLEILILRLCFIGDSGTTVVAESLRFCGNLQELNLGSNKIGGEGCTALSRGLQKCRKLQKLDLSINKIGDEGCAALSRGLPGCRELQELRLWSCSIGDTGAIAVAESLRFWGNLQKLNLGLNAIGGKGCAALSRGLQECRELQMLVLTGNEIGDEGCAALSRGLQECRKLQELNLISCSIGDTGATALAGCLRSCVNLQHLNLQWNSLTDASVKSIAELITTVKSLKILLLWRNTFTEGGKTQLRQAAEERKHSPDFVELDLKLTLFR